MEMTFYLILRGPFHLKQAPTLVLLKNLGQRLQVQRQFRHSQMVRSQFRHSQKPAPAVTTGAAVRPPAGAMKRVWMEVSGGCQILLIWRCS